MFGDTYTTNNNIIPIHAMKWKPVPKGTHNVEVRLHRDGKSIMVYVPRLPGCASQGDTFDQALDHIEEALIGVIK